MADQVRRSSRTTAGQRRDENCIHPDEAVALQAQNDAVSSIRGTANALTLFDADAPSGSEGNTTTRGRCSSSSNTGGSAG